MRGNVACNSPKKVALYRFSVSLLIGFPGKNPFRYVSSSSPDLSHSLSLLRFQFPKIKLFSSNANRRRVLSLEFEKSRIEIGRYAYFLFWFGITRKVALLVLAQSLRSRLDVPQIAIGFLIVDHLLLCSFSVLLSGNQKERTVGPTPFLFFF